jgi:parvulin-like peptidyl-prolyl isomerase
LLRVRARFDFPTRRVSRLFRISALLLPIVLAACGGDGGPKAVPADAVALVGNEPIARSALVAELAANRRAAGLKGAQFPAAGTKAYATARNKAVDELVQEAELKQRAKSQFGITIGDEQVDRQVAQLRTRAAAGSEARFRRVLAQQGLTEGRLRERLRQQLLGEAVFTRLSADTSVSEDDIEQYYRSHRKGYERPATRQVSHILVATRAQADGLERKLRNGADFAALAKRYSNDTATARAGGVMSGAITRGETIPAFDRVAFSLKTNEVSQPFHTASGWEIVEATSDVTPESATPLSEVHSTIEAALLTAKRQNALDDWARETRRKHAKRVVYAEGFASVPLPPSG